MAALFRLRYETGRKSFSVCAPILISRGDMRGIKGLTSFTNDSIRCINVDLRVVADLYSFSLCFLFPFRKCRSGRRIGKGLIVRAIARNTKVLATFNEQSGTAIRWFFGQARFDSCISGIRHSSHSITPPKPLGCKGSGDIGYLFSGRIPPAFVVVRSYGSDNPG